MKSRNLIYISIGAILITGCVGVVYINLDNGSNLPENTFKINTTNTINGTDANRSIDYNSTNKIIQVKDINGSSSTERKNEPSNIPKKSSLSYSEAFNIAKTFEGSGDMPIETYKKYNGYEWDEGNLYWKFNIYSKKK